MLATAQENLSRSLMHESPRSSAARRGSPDPAETDDRRSPLLRISLYELSGWPEVATQASGSHENIESAFDVRGVASVGSFEPTEVTKSQEVLKN